MIARVAELREQQRLGRLAAARGDGADAALQRRDPLLERGHGRVAEPRVDVPVLLQREQVGGVLRVLEHERGGLVDRDGARPGGRVRASAGVDRAGAHAPVPVSGVAHSHDGTVRDAMTTLPGPLVDPHLAGRASRRGRPAGARDDRLPRPADDARQGLRHPLRPHRVGALAHPRQRVRRRHRRPRRAAPDAELHVPVARALRGRDERARRRGRDRGRPLRPQRDDLVDARCGGCCAPTGSTTRRCSTAAGRAGRARSATSPRRSAARASRRASGPS